MLLEKSLKFVVVAMFLGLLGPVSAQEQPSPTDVQILEEAATNLLSETGQNGEDLGFTDDPSKAEIDELQLILATGPVNGVFYPSGGAICNLVGPALEGLASCVIRSTSGSKENLRLLHDERVQLGLVQSDWAYFAHRGLGEFDGDSVQSELRVLFSLYSNPAMVIVKNDSPYQTVKDLVGKRVNLGLEGSGQWALATILLGEFDMGPEDFSEALYYGGEEQARRFCRSEFDGLILADHPPSNMVAAILAQCKGRLIKFDEKTFSSLIERNSYFEPVLIEGGSYPRQTDPIHSFGLRALIVGNKSLPDNIVERFVEAIFTNIEGLRAQHPALKLIDVERMEKEGRVAPLHEGAEAFFSRAKDDG